MWTECGLGKNIQTLKKLSNHGESVICGVLGGYSGGQGGIRTLGNRETTRP